MKGTFAASYILTTSGSLESTTVSEVLPLNLHFQLGRNTALL